jgi:two-component system chemotaxis response regulator CheB
VVLSGTRHDGTAGLRAIHDRGGLGVVQDPEEALFSGMPRSALVGDHPDHVVSVNGMGELLAKLARDGPLDEEGRSVPMADELDVELRWAKPDVDSAPPVDPPFGKPSGFTCPECHGGLWEIEEEGFPRYRCRVGHGFSAESLLITQRADVEAALWTAYRSLQERVALLLRLADRAHGRHADITAEHFQAEAVELRRQADVLRSVLWLDPSDAGESDPAAS